MAFEERCSPNQANSPGPINGRVPQLHPDKHQPTYNESSYSCTTIKLQQNTPPSSPDFYYRNVEIKQEPEEIQTKEPVSIPFSITDILKPEFGLSALRSKKLEGPKAVGPNHSILYKPYEVSKPVQSIASLKNTVTSIGAQDVERRRPASVSSTESSNASSVNEGSQPSGTNNTTLWPAWIYCTRYSDRPSSGPRSRGPRSRRMKRQTNPEEKRPRTAFSSAQLARLKHEFAENRYLTERRRQSLSSELGLAEAQIKIWFQNKRAKIKKASGQRNPLALQLMAQGLYNHSTATDSEEEEISVT